MTSMDGVGLSGATKDTASRAFPPMGITKALGTKSNCRLRYISQQVSRTNLECFFKALFFKLQSTACVTHARFFNSFIDTS